MTTEIIDVYNREVQYILYKSKRSTPVLPVWVWACYGNRYGRYVAYIVQPKSKQDGDICSDSERQ